ncbi:hypothetical protein [Curtobacterium sp. Leaf261]|uniref:hypothetical protein n=1 Tax=Curtobacterium sp. Leaf261 TaxID=1736311 RepID=UPI0006FC9210|nr:hypothetical protein [Curtobacterium sp. Leaf261]KQO61255.1 hypothetical protein ASF23_12235 [Curtobacterium sp. Leaf261]
MTDTQPESTEPQNLAPQADDSSLRESQAAIDDAKHHAAAELDVSEDEELAADGAPVAGDSAPADGPAPAA